MKRYIVLFISTLCFCSAFAQSYKMTIKGTCGEDLVWTFDGQTLSIKNVSKKSSLKPMEDYDTHKNLAPWIKKKLKIKKVEINENISRIGSCAFQGCDELTIVDFKSSEVEEIGWGAFMDCKNLNDITLPEGLSKIEPIAFANCGNLTHITIPGYCRVEEQAFVSCRNVKSLNVASTASLGHYVFANEVIDGEQLRHSLYNSNIECLPSFINISNCNEYGIAKEAIQNIESGKGYVQNYDLATSAVDTIIPQSFITRSDTYALIIGNQNYRFDTNVPFAIHDAHVFAEYCKTALGIPEENIHVCDDATKHMIYEDEMSWLKNIDDREDKRLIFYYAGHGVPDTRNPQNIKAYLLPTDVRGVNPDRGIALDDLYSSFGELNFAHTNVFLDACFSGMNRNDKSISDATARGIAVVAERGTLSEGNIVVFSAAKGNETAQGYQDEGHGLFTYYLLDKLKSSNGSCKLGELSDYIHDNVSVQSLKLKLRKQQTPTTQSSNAISELWRSLTF